ncbi:hypothetical protein RvY_02816 [Ramazzottius varieornatus]|uniref:Uncharacterized protein n=1 Tax=Ramazzottius varieornatus TaxID=947166 RepID=A0A1D1UL00_RAMVA|nr:hypothetical protein RvY_02816 [Ramazzottius varieornatus]
MMFTFPILIALSSFTLAWSVAQAFEVPSHSSMRPPTPPAPPPKSPPSFQEAKKILAEAITTLKPAQLRDGLLRSAEGGFMGSAEGIGGLLAQLLKLEALMAALSPPAASPPASGSGAAPPAPPPAAGTPPAGGTPPAAGSPPAGAPPPAGGSPPDLSKLLSLMALSGGFGSGDDADEMALGYDDRNTVNCTSDGITRGICDSHNSINNLITFPDHVLAVGAEDVFKVAADGTPIDAFGDPKFYVFQKLNGTPTASLQIEHLFYVFFGTEVALLNNQTSATFHQRLPVRDLFFKVDRPVIGAFRFNDHTLTIFYETHFVFYQPLMNPPIDPRFSPQPNSVIPNGPDKIDGALQINGTNFLYRQGWLYEIAKNEMVVVAKRPLRKSRGDSGWIKCGQQSCN